MLVIAGENDTRVDPLHAKKFVALAQNNPAGQSRVAQDGLRLRPRQRQVHPRNRSKTVKHGCKFIPHDWRIETGGHGKTMRTKIMSYTSVIRRLAALAHVVRDRQRPVSLIRTAATRDCRASPLPTTAGASRFRVASTNLVG